MAVSAYPYATGADPTYDAWKAQADYKRQNSWYDAAQRQQQADEQYKQALAQLDQASNTGTRNINTNMLQRGVFSSGETNRRQAELQAGILQGRAQADATKAGMFGQISTDLQRALTSLDLDQEGQIQAALARKQALAGAGGGGSSGGGGGGGGSRPGLTSTPLVGAVVGTPLGAGAPMPTYQQPAARPSWWAQPAVAVKKATTPVKPLAKYNTRLS